VLFSMPALPEGQPTDTNLHLKGDLYRVGVKRKF